MRVLTSESGLSHGTLRSIYLSLGPLTFSSPSSDSSFLSSGVHLGKEVDEIGKSSDSEARDGISSALHL